MIATLPDGQAVHAVGATVNRFMEVETSLSGALLHGFASANFLGPLAEPTPITPVVPTPVPPGEAIPMAVLPARAGGATSRDAPADAHSLNEPGRPGRTGSSPKDLTASIAAIIDWLAVDDAAHLRYQPHDGLTFCNIYAHDFCFLTGCYLPRVWWVCLSRCPRSAYIWWLSCH